MARSPLDNCGDEEAMQIIAGQFKYPVSLAAKNLNLTLLELREYCRRLGMQLNDE